MTEVPRDEQSIHLSNRTGSAIRIDVSHDETVVRGRNQIEVPDNDAVIIFTGRIRALTIQTI